MTKLELLLGTITDEVLEMMVYGRKNDEELTVEDVEQLFKSGEANMTVLTKAFQDAVREHFPEVKE